MPTSPKSISRLGKYRLVRQIGQGGMGRVYLGVNDETGEQVAVKVLSSKRVRNQTYVDRFYREAEAAGVLQHPNIVGAIEVGEYEKRHYFVMEYIEGETARQRLKRKRSLDEAEALSICEKVALALAFAEQHSIVHRDIKPDNIMLGSHGEVLVVDWGLAKVVGRLDRAVAAGDLDVVATDRSRGSAHMTQVGQVAGTPAYMPPEQARGDVDA
ncbi:MAG: serine/threonine-protein kinase, partial [Planctomycetota bacterium]|nr:serine/threonine-protein kinase [Planctomycetota bacterium]